MAHCQNYLYKNVQRQSKLLCYFHVLTSIQLLILKTGYITQKEQFILMFC